MRRPAIGDAFPPGAAGNHDAEQDWPHVTGNRPLQVRRWGLACLRALAWSSGAAPSPRHRPLPRPDRCVRAQVDARVERFQHWLRLLLFHLLDALSCLADVPEAAWVGALSCLVHLVTHQGERRLPAAWVQGAGATRQEGLAARQEAAPPALECMCESPGGRALACFSRRPCGACLCGGPTPEGSGSVRAAEPAAALGGGPARVGAGASGQPPVHAGECRASSAPACCLVPQLCKSGRQLQLLPRMPGRLRRLAGLQGDDVLHRSTRSPSLNDSLHSMGEKRLAGVAAAAPMRHAALHRTHT